MERRHASGQAPCRSPAPAPAGRRWRRDLRERRLIRCEELGHSRDEKSQTSDSGVCAHWQVEATSAVCVVVRVRHTCFTRLFSQI